MSSKEQDEPGIKFPTQETIDSGVAVLVKHFGAGREALYEAAVRDMWKVLGSPQITASYPISRRAHHP
jgi:hypothetical protein